MSNSQTMTSAVAAAAQTQQGITEITVGGFKSIATPQSIEVHPLTILAGANSSGKSSFMQPLLLLKQTLEARYDPGPLWLDGYNVRFTSGEQLLTKVQDKNVRDSFEITVKIASDPFVGPEFGAMVVFRYRQGRGFEVHETQTFVKGHPAITLRPGMSHEEISAAVRPLKPSVPSGGQWSLIAERFLLVPQYLVYGEAYNQLSVLVFVPQTRNIIHVPGLRGNSQRAYPSTAPGPNFPGTFDHYVGGMVDRWQAEVEEGPLTTLNNQLNGLGLTRTIRAEHINDAQIELRVDRLPTNSRSRADLVNIADVGFGVPTVLPVLVALIAAQPGQAVYIEQPELHLHPRAQVRLADVLADAAKRGVRVIAETHSSLLIRGIQTLVAKGELDPKLVKLHWFTRNEADGATNVTSADLDENGAFGDWPMDFDDVELRSEGDYLDAVELRGK